MHIVNMIKRVLRSPRAGRKVLRAWAKQRRPIHERQVTRRHLGRYLHW